MDSRQLFKLSLSQAQAALGTQKDGKNSACPNWFLACSFQLGYESALLTFQTANPKSVYRISTVNHLMVFEAFFMRTSFCWMFSPILFHTVRFLLENLINYKERGFNILNVKEYLRPSNSDIVLSFFKTWSNYISSLTYLPLRKSRHSALCCYLKERSILKKCLKFYSELND